MSNPVEKSDLKKYLMGLEKRIARIEKHLNIEPGQDAKADDLPPLIPENLAERAENLELQIGEFWFAKTGIVALAIGVVFLLTFPYQNLPPIFPSLVGYIIAGVISALSYYWRKSFQLVSRYLLGGALLLLFFSSMRLNFFTSQPSVANRSLVIGLMMAVVVLNLYIATRRKSAYIFGLNLSLGYVTALVSGNPIFIFTVISLLSIATVYFRVRFQWKSLMIAGILLTLFAHLTWMLNNPFLGHQLKLVSGPQINLVFLMLYVAIFTAGNYLSTREGEEDFYSVISNLLICFGGYGLYLLFTLNQIKTDPAIYHLSASAFFLLLSVVLWVRHRSQISTFFLAITGYTALSTAILLQFSSPTSFFWLCWESLLVIITALWFRSKIIVLANFIIFLLIYTASLIVTHGASLVGLSFGFVALLSARIMNWQRHRLELKTELMRNSYLTAAFLIIPYALYHAVSGSYVILAWIGVAAFYYLLSLALKNKKYRWMALMTLLLTILYIFIIGIIGMDPIYRIISFIALGIVLLFISLLYTRFRAKSGARANEESNQST